MSGAKVAIWVGALIALFSSDILSQIFHVIGVRPFPYAETNHFALTFGLCILIGGIVAYGYERKP